MGQQKLKEAKYEDNAIMMDLATMSLEDALDYGKQMPNQKMI